MYLFNNVCNEKNIEPVAMAFDSYGEIYLHSTQNSFGCFGLMDVLTFSFVGQNESFCQNMLKLMTEIIDKYEHVPYNTNLLQ